MSLGATLLSAIGGPDSEIAKETIALAAKHGDAAIGTHKGNSLVAAAQKTMIRPMVIVEQSIVHQDYASDLMTIIQLRDIQATLSYLRLSGSIGGVSISDYIDPIRPVRAAGRKLGSFGGLESFGGTNLIKPELPVEGQEALELRYNDKTIEQGAAAKKAVSVDSKSAQSVLSEYVPLALGRTVEAQVTVGGDVVNFPLTFRQVPVPMSQRDLERVFVNAKGDDSWDTRFDKLEVGMITTPQLLRGSDVIKEKFRVRLEDMKANTNYINDSIKQQRSHMTAAIRTGKMSVNNMANSFVITDATARQIELATGKRFANQSQRETLWKGITANTIVICNEARGLFTFYTMGEKLPEEYTRNDLKQKAAKESSVGSLADIMKLLNGGM